MGQTYVKKYEINTIDFDMNRHLRAITIINFLQDISTRHYVSALRENNLKDEDGFWVIVEWDVIIKQYPDRAQWLSVLTEPIYFRKFIAYRRYEITDESGQIIATATSKWAYMSIQKHAQTNIPAYIYEMFGVEASAEKPDRLPKLFMPETDAYSFTTRVAYSDIDVNGHVNNGAYFHWLMDAIPEVISEARYPKQIQIHYRNEMFNGEEVRIKLAKAPKQEDLQLIGTQYLVSEIENHEKTAVQCVLSW